MSMFCIGEIVWYHNKKAKVAAYVGGAERRYYVDMRQGRWSAPEKYLFKSNISGEDTPQIRYERSKVTR